MKKTVSTVLAGTIGTGNIAGIASAIAVGGTGAIFCMRGISFFSMDTKISEVILAVKYREKKKNKFNLQKFIIQIILGQIVNLHKK